MQQCACLRSKSMKGWAMREKEMPPTNGRSSSTGARHTRRMVLICTVRMRTAITGVMFTAGSTFSLPVRQQMRQISTAAAAGPRI